MEIYYREYGVEATFDFELFEVDGIDFRVNASHALGDVKISKNEGSEANTTNGFVDRGTGYSLTLTAAEMQAARIAVYIVDQTGTKVWLDRAFTVETYGHASAQHEAFPANVTQLNGSTTAAEAFADMLSIVPEFTVQSGSTTTVIQTNLSGTLGNNRINGRVVYFKAGSTLESEAAVISTYDDSTGQITLVGALTAAPATNDKGRIS